jgi:3-mercaptopyruvate sulfurtransferase SseA
MIKNYQDMIHIVTTNNKNEQIVDARPPNVFNGKILRLIRIILKLY